MTTKATAGFTARRPATGPSIRKTLFGSIEGKPVDCFTLTNRRGMTATIIGYGGIVTSLMVPDGRGRLDDLVLGFGELRSYLDPDYLRACPYFGALIGRYGNRIGGAAFSLDEVAYSLARNNGPNNLHGGVRGFDKVVWDAKEADAGTGVGLELTYKSRDGEEGFPGTLTATVLYSVTDANEVRIDYSATTDKPTVCNLTHHSYFNLAGEGRGDILDTEISLRAGAFTPVDATLIPTGESRDVSGTPFDFRKPVPIGARIDADDEQIALGGGYDHNWIIDRTKGSSGPVLAATAYDPKSGRAMDVLTTEPGIQLYTGNFLDGTLRGKSGAPYLHRGGFCLETQHYPDSPNKPAWPSVVLRPEQVYRSTTVYKFYTK